MNVRLPLSHLAIALVVFVAGLALAAPAQAAPFQEPLNFTLASGDTYECQTLTIPSGTQLTVSFVSVYTEASTTGQQVTSVFLFTTISGQSSDAFLAVPVVSTGAVSYVGTQVMTAFADSGSNSRLCVGRSTGTGTMSVYATVTGTTA
ncbi:MAG TPA: hypothetical protein DD490_29760 [Acidobacteria bacterium]|nr:hypothetical protein [Acidobacteriota bacterium]